MLPDNLTTDQYLGIGVKLANRWLGREASTWNRSAKVVQRQARQFAELTARCALLDEGQEFVETIVKEVLG